MRVITIFAVLSALVACRGSSDAELDMTTYESTLVEAHGIKLRGKLVRLPTTTAAIIALLGKPERIEINPGTNDILVWDLLGVYAYRDNAPGRTRGNTRGRINAISFSYRPEEFVFVPKTNYSGVIAVPNGVLTKSTTRSQIEKLGFQETPECPGLYVLELPESSVFAAFDEESCLVNVTYED